MTTVRPEYPRPQFVRKDWINLNGVWTFCHDFGKSGQDRGRQWQRSRGFDSEIKVPFCPESELSGVGYRDFIECMWYHRTFTIPDGWRGKRIIVHFGAVDYESQLFIDGEPVGIHFGGSASFSYDITSFVEPGREHHLVLHVLDETRGGSMQPRGKQSPAFASFGCLYTRTTGIWQTVWLEAIHPRGLKDIHIVPDLDGGRFIVTPSFFADPAGLTVSAVLKAEGKTAAEDRVAASQGGSLILEVREPRAWQTEDPFLYDLELSVDDEKGASLDGAESYAGLRKVHVAGDRIFLNNKPIYLRLVLDQGYYPDGIWTAPSDKALRQDIELSKRAGFNGARLHQKVFEERFHYWADRLGYLTWGESASWGCNVNSVIGHRNFITEWGEVVMRDRNHPSIIAWTPFNETGTVSDPRQHARIHVDAYNLCKALDPTRPVNDSSGHAHWKTDLWTVHNYEQDPALLQRQLSDKEDRGAYRNSTQLWPGYGGQPYLIDEFGGMKWAPAEKKDLPEVDGDVSKPWGYGRPPDTLQQYYSRLEGLIEAILSQKHISGYCYTQLTDVEQEQNGIYLYSRQDKLDMKKIRSIFSRNPAF
jgi:beta-galactosidase/beta-glucuronidase